MLEGYCMVCPHKEKGECPTAGLTLSGRLMISHTKLPAYTNSFSRHFPTTIRPKSKDAPSHGGGQKTPTTRPRSRIKTRALTASTGQRTQASEDLHAAGRKSRICSGGLKAIHDNDFGERAARGYLHRSMQF